MATILSSGSLAGYFNDHAIESFLIANRHRLSGNVLDIGCGKMRQKKIILSGEDVTSYTGLDLDAGKFTYSVPADLYWDGTKIPLANNSIDSALLLEVIEHCPDPSIVVTEACRVLKPGGVILFSTPFLYPLHGTPYDYHRPTPFYLKDLFHKAGFTDVHLESGGCWDASLGQMIALWISHRPMPTLARKILRKLFVPIFKFLLMLDKRQPATPFTDGVMMPNILGQAYKPK